MKRGLTGNRTRRGRSGVVDGRRSGPATVTRRGAAGGSGLQLGGLFGSDALAWYRHDIGVGFPAQRVNAWRDLYRTPFDLSLVSGTDHPLHVLSGGLNGQGYVHFDGQPLSHAVTAQGSGPAGSNPHGFCVGRWHTTPVSTEIMVALATSSDALWLYVDGGNFRALGSTDVSLVAVTGAAVDTSWHLFEFAQDGTLLSLRLDGGAAVTAGLTGTMDWSADDFQVLLGAGANVDVAELLIVAQPPTAAQRAAVIADFNARYGQGWA